MNKAAQVVVALEDGTSKTYIVKKPSYKHQAKAQQYASKIFKEARQTGAYFRDKLEQSLVQDGVLSVEHTEKLRKIQSELNSVIEQLDSGKNTEGKQLKLSEGRVLAIQAKHLRTALLVLSSKLRKFDQYTVEGMAENARFDFLVSECVFDEENNRVFVDVDDYYEKRDEKYAEEVASKLATLIYTQDEDWEKKLPENQFLIKHKFVDDEMYYIDKNGNRVNVDGEPVTTTDSLESVVEPMFIDDVNV